MIVDLLIRNALVLTLEAGAAPIFRGYVAVQGGKIRAVGRPPASGSCPRPGKSWTWRVPWFSPGW